MTDYFMRKTMRKLPGIVIKQIPKPEPILKCGLGASDSIGKICAQAGYQSALVVTD